MHQRVLQGYIGAGLDRQVDIGKLGEHGDPGIDHDQREFTFLQRFLEAPVDDRMLLRQVRAPGNQAMGVLEILVAAGRPVGAERPLVPGHGRGHAQGGVAVVVVGADQAPGELAQGVELLGENLPGRYHRKGVAPVFTLDAANFGDHVIEGAIPGHRCQGLAQVAAQQGLVAASLGLEQLVFEHPLEAELAAVDVGTADTTRGDHPPLRVLADFDGATRGTIATGGIGPVGDFLVGNTDGILAVATEQHGYLRDSTCRVPRVTSTVSPPTRTWTGRPRRLSSSICSRLRRPATRPRSIAKV